MKVSLSWKYMVMHRIFDKNMDLFNNILPRSFIKIVLLKNDFSQK